MARESCENTYAYRHWGMVSMYSASHFLVDLACAFFMFRAVSGTPDGYLCVLLYNFCAFAMQMPLGVIADRCDRNHLFAAAGCFIVVAAYSLWNFPVAAAVALGTGNALFHLGGGIDVLNVSEKKMGALGVFVSPGAFGIFLGTLLGRGDSAAVMPVLLPAAVAAAIIILRMRKANSEAYLDNAPFSLETKIPGKALPAAACFFIVVCLRSYMGLSLDFPWKTTALLGVALVCAVAFGKAAGGFLSDRFGISRTTALSLGLAALLFLWGQVPGAGIAATFLFNMTMPVTLWCMAGLFPKAKGFSFGLLTFGLFIGFLPVYLGASVPAGIPWLFPAGAAVSLAFLLAGLRKARA
ncbi:MAG: hypothetical protein FWG03_08075 [Clostridiales bacterium]|nr:hypothetical protein [Clostridiales bacterium]